MQASFRRMRKVLIACVVCVSLCPGIPAMAETLSSLEEQSNQLQQEVSSVNQDISALSGQIASIEADIETGNAELETTQNDIEMTREQLAIAKANEAKQKEKTANQIQVMYEKGTYSSLDMILSASSMAEIFSAIDVAKNLEKTYSDQLDEFIAIHKTVEEQEKVLEEKEAALIEQQEELEAKKSDLQSKRSELESQAAAVQADLNQVNGQIQAKKEEIAAEQARARAAAEAEERAAAAAAAQAASSSSDSDDGDYSYSSSSSSYTTSSGGLTKYKGVVYYGGHRETYYSQKVLPGGGLSIPGRHVADDGTVRDGDGYICVASSDLAAGTEVDTSLGKAKVYDSGCASGTIDIYTDW